MNSHTHPHLSTLCLTQCGHSSYIHILKFDNDPLLTMPSFYRSIQQSLNTCRLVVLLFFPPCAQLPYRCQVLPTTSPSACFCQRERRGGKQSTHKAVPVCCIRHEGSGGAEEQRFNPALPLCCPHRRIYFIIPPQTVCHSQHATHTHTHTHTYARFG